MRCITSLRALDAKAIMIDGGMTAQDFKSTEFGIHTCGAGRT